MKRIILTVATAILLFASCSKSSGGGSRGSAKMENDLDSVAYIIGMNIGQNLIEMDSTLNIKALCKGIEDVYTANENISFEDAKSYYLRYVAYAKAEKIRAYEEQFLEDIMESTRSYARTRTGITYTIEVVGDETQTAASSRDSLKLRYTIQTADGEEVFSSYEKGDTLSTTLGDLRKGMQESVKLIGKSGKILAWIPASACYGEVGDKELGVKPNATLFYEIEIIDVNKYSSYSRK